MALWKDIKGFEGLYMVSSDGEVYALPKAVMTGNGETHRKGKYLKAGKRGRGKTKYLFVVLTNGEQTKHCSVHRLVAEAFIANPNDLPEVNHKDEDTFNNRAENLEWCDRQYNIEYSKNKPVTQYTKDGKKVAEYKSIKFAAKMTGIK